MACVAWLGVLEGPGCAHAPWSRFELHCSGIIVARRLYSCCVWCAVEHLKDDTVQKSEERSTAAQYANPNRHTTPYRALFPISIQTTDSPTKVILFHSFFRICICTRQLRLLVARSLYTILVLWWWRTNLVLYPARRSDHFDNIFIILDDNTKSNRSLLIKMRIYPSAYADWDLLCVSTRRIRPKLPDRANSATHQPISSSVSQEWKSFPPPPQQMRLGCVALHLRGIGINKQINYIPRCRSLQESPVKWTPMRKADGMVRYTSVMALVGRRVAWVEQKKRFWWYVIIYGIHLKNS